VPTLGLTILLAASSVADRKAALHALFDEAWELRLREDPLFATQMGEHRFDALLPSMRPEDLDRRAAYQRDALAPGSAGPAGRPRTSDNGSPRPWFCSCFMTSTFN